MSWGFNSLGLVAAVAAMVLVSVGLVLVEMSQHLAKAKPRASAVCMLFAEPMTRSGLFLGMTSVVLVALTSAVPGIIDGQWGNAWEEWLPSSLLTQSAALLMAAVVCLLSVRALRQAFWLHAATMIGSTGGFLLAANLLQWSPNSSLIACLIASNLLVALAQLIRLHPARFEALLRVPAAEGERAFFGWPLFVTIALLIGQLAYLGIILQSSVPAAPGWPWILSSLLMGVCFLQVWLLLRRVELVHLLIVTSLVSTGGAGLILDWRFFAIDVQLATLALVWGAVSLLSRRRTPLTVKSLGLTLATNQCEQAAQAMTYWWFGMTSVSLLITLPVSLHWQLGFSNTLITLALATAGSAVGGYLWRSPKLVTLASILFPASMVSAALVYGGLMLLLEFAGLIGAVIGIGYLCLARLFAPGATERERNGFQTATGEILGSMSEILVGLGAVFTPVAMSQLEPTIPLAVSLGLIGAYWLWLAWDSTRERLVYFGLIASLGFLFYLVAGILRIPVEASPMAAFSVIGASFLLFGINILSSRATESKLSVFVRPTYYLAVLAPLALLAATPFGLKQVAALTVLAASAFYMFVAHRIQARWATYVAIVLFNVAIYIWLPAVREYTGLVQLYVIPAAVTVLVFAHLHRNELNHHALSSIRFAASGAILATSTIEVLVMDEPTLLKFLAVLLLSLLGTAAGIALRVRPFVFIGLAFLVLNVIGQLGLQFQHESGIVRAVILIAVGVLILGVMIFFNVHRERILRQYRIFLTDKQWE